MKTYVTQNDKKEIPTEVIADSIIAISEGLKKIRAGRLNSKAIELLIQNAAPSVGSYPSKKVAISDVRAVLEGIESLERVYLKKNPK